MIYQIWPYAYSPMLCRMYRHSVGPEAIQNWRGTKYKLLAQNFLMFPCTFLWCPSMREGTTNNKVGTTNSFLLVLTR